MRKTVSRICKKLQRLMPQKGGGCSVKGHIYGYFMCQCLKTKTRSDIYKKDVVRGRKWLGVTKKIITDNWRLKDIKKFKKAEKYFIEGRQQKVTSKTCVKSGCRESRDKSKTIDSDKLVSVSCQGI